MIEEVIYYSCTGRADNCILHGLHMASSQDELRKRGIALLLDLHDRQLASDERPTAAVWLGKALLKPTKEELEAFRAQAAAIIARGAELRARGDDGVEPPPVTDGIVARQAEPTYDDIEAAAKMTLPENGDDAYGLDFDLVDDDFDF